MDYAQILNNFAIVVAILTLILHIFCGVAIARDTNNLARHHLDTQLLFAGMWVIVGLVAGIWGLFIYWTMHHSTFARR